MDPFGRHKIRHASFSRNAVREYENEPSAYLAKETRLRGEPRLVSRLPDAD
jgi:hypothetical protein